MTRSLFGDDLPSLDLDQVQAILGDQSKIMKWENKLGEMVSAAEHALREQLGEREDIGKLALGVVFWLVESMGGDVMYMPKGKELKTAITHRQIYNDWRFNGMSVEKLARKYRMGMNSVYPILAKQRLLQRKLEPDLFGFDDTSEPSRPR